MFNHNRHNGVHDRHKVKIVSVVHPVVSIVVKPRFHFVGKKSALEKTGTLAPLPVRASISTETPPPLI